MEENNAQSVPTERVDDRYDRQMFRILRNIDLNLLTIFEAVYVHNGIVNAAKIARECSLGARINTVMQMAFFHLTQILPGDSALAELQGAIAKSYSSKGQELVERNWQALALARESLAEVPLQQVDANSPDRKSVV